MKNSIDKLEAAIDTCAESGYAEYTEVANLLSAAGEALGVFKTYGEINIKNLLIGVSRLSAAGGDYLSDDLT